MPIIKSAKKALRQSSRRKKFNLARKRAMTDIFRKIKKLKTENLLPLAYKAIDKAAKRGVIEKRAASRKKSQMAKLFKK
jgi:small subunit ribosomal protein S20